MALLARAAWTISAALFLLLCWCLVQADYTGAVPALILLALAALCTIRPAAGLEIAVAIVPVASYLMTQRWNRTISWSEAFVCAALAGLSIHAALRDGPAARAATLPLALRAPALVLGAVIVSSTVATVGVKAIALGPAFVSELISQFTRDYFVDLRTFAGLHAGLLLLEGLVLFVLAARVASGAPAALSRIAASAVAGASVAGLLNVARLVQSALRSDTLWRALGERAMTLRWNVEYGDFNAAGSYFVMLLPLAAALAALPRGRQPAARALPVLSVAIVGTALWLTGSRAAYIAGVLGLSAALALQRVRGPARRRLAAAAGVAAAVVAGAALVAIASPPRGNQHSSLTAVDVRFQMAMVGVRMIESHPVFGIGLGEFHQRSGEFATQALYSEFPVAVHENAHNNFLQVAAELGLAGGVPFVWLVVAAIATIGRRAAQTRDLLLVCAFAGLVAFVVSWLAGHPLLIPEPAYVFWILLGAATGAATAGAERRNGGWLRACVATAVVAIALSLPLQMRSLAADADLEHVGIGLSSSWQVSPDGVKYRAATGHATIFPPAHSGFMFSVFSRTDRPVRLELRLDGRLADVVPLAPGRWNDISLPARSERAAARYVPLQLRVLDGDQIEIWVTKVRPLER